MHITPSVRSLLFGLIVLTLVVLTMSAPSVAQISIAIRIGPPALPVYEQPICPGDGYMWTPGYWAYDYDINDYYWVPGTWIEAPEVGFLWTPGWWGWGGDAFIFHEGYWGPHIGFYGGINYGFGYFGAGFVGGRWDGGHFFYNRAVLNVNVVNIHNVYNETVVRETTVNRVSFNGGNGGITARPTREEEAAEHDRHIAPIAEQKQHLEAARTNPQMRASVNHGRPAIAATPRAGAFNDRGAAPAREEGAAHPPSDAKDLHPHARMAAPNTGNAKQDQKFQQQQDKLAAQQEKEHQQMAKQQEKEHQQMAKQNADEPAKQQMEQRHQQQTQQMEEKHTQQQQHLQEREGGGRPK